MNIKNTTIFLASAALFAGAALTVDAGSTCQVVYGGGEVCPPEVKLEVDKKVQAPTKGGVFVDKITMNDAAKYTPNQEVPYKITVRNNSNRDLTNITVTDRLPEYLTYVSGEGTYDRNANVVTVKIDKLEKGKARDINVITKVIAEKLPADENVICEVINTAEVVIDKGRFSDQAEICIEKTVQKKDGGPVVQQTPPLKQTPQTGPGMLSLAALIPTGALGVFLNRKTRING